MSAQLRHRQEQRAKGLTSGELMAITGLSHRQLDHWTTNGILTPIGGVGTGNPRRFPPSEVAKAKAMAALRDAGFDLQHTVQHLDHLIRHGGYQAGPVTVTYTPEHT